ncbi:Histone acetyltransferase [Phytophthora cactorum]|nr:Histone acetyltransferase [Phytophthora cactorum]
MPVTPNIAKDKEKSFPWYTSSSTGLVRQAIMDSSHAFVGDFSMNMNGGDNRFLNQFNLGGGGTVNSGTMGGMDLFGGLDFSSGMNLMTDSSMMLGGNSSTSTAGLIDFPDELNSPTTSSSGPSSSSLMMDTSVSMMTASSAPMSSTTDAIPFPASLASESLTNSGTSSSSSSGLDVMNFMNTTTTSSAMNNNGNGMGLDMNMGMNMGINMGMNMGMNNMGMDMTSNNFGMNDANNMMFNNMQHMNMMNQQGNYYMPQQQMQQQHYMQMMHQQRQLNLQRQQQQQKALLERQRLAQQQQAMKNNSNQQTQQQQQAVQQKQQQMLAAGQLPSQMAAQRQMSGGNPSVDATANANAARSQPQASTQNTGTPPTSTRPAWQSSADQALRKEMLNHIMRVLQNQRSNAPANWLQKLPEMAHRLEDECYRIASSREEYANTSTLQSRLRSIVRSAQTHQRSVGANAMRQPNQASPANNRPATSTSAATPIPFPGVQAVASTLNGVSSDVNDLAAQAIQMPPELQDPPSQVNTPVKAEAAQAQGLLQSTPSALDSAMTDRLSMSGTGISPLAGQNGVQTTPRSGGGNVSGNATGSGPQTASSPASAARNKSAQIIWQFKAKAQQVTSALDKNQTTEYHNKLRLMVRDDVKTPGSKEVLQRQQQRLLLLRHAMWCKSPEGTCTTTPSCGEMKRLWAHMGACRQTNACSYNHCISSKYVLSHFQQCVNAKCLVCQVVRYPVEVKEKNGALMLDADRALQQIIAASQRRQRMLAMKKQQEMQHQMQQSQQPQQQMPLAMPAHLQQTQNSGNVAAMNFQQPQQNVGQTANHATPMGVNMNSMGMAMPNGGNRSVPMPTAQSNTQPAVSSNGMMSQEGNVKTENTGAPTNLVPDDQRQFQLIKQKLNGRSLEQLTAHCVKLEKWVEEIRARMNAIMNECRQLLHLSNSTQDPMQKTQYETQVQDKRVMLKQLDVKFKQCRSQRNIVKHVIDERNAASAMSSQNGVNNAVSAMQPIPMPAQMQHQHSFPQPQVPTTPASSTKPSPDDLLGEEDDAPSKTDSSLAAAGKPLEMPMDLQDTSATPVSVAAPLNMLTAPQQLMGNHSMTVMNVSRPALPMNHVQGKGYGQMLANGGTGSMASGSFGDMVKVEPKVKSDSSVTTSSAQATASAVKEEVAINPLTMNNPKLNAMMSEHRRMDASTSLQLPAGAVGTPKALITTSGGDTTSNAAVTPTPAPPASSEVPMSVLNELSNENLASHVDSLITYYNATVSPANLKKKLEGILKGMMEHKFGWVFNTPVDPVALNIPNYFKIIRKPMDLGTVKKKLEVGIYKHTEEFADDVRTTFLNAMQYNSEDQDVYSLAKDMLADFNSEMRKVAAEIEVDEKAARAKESSCRLCGIERMVFEPAVLYCNGECNSRIRRNCYYYTSADNKYHCCHPCHANLPETIKHNEGRQYQKNELARKKNDEVHEEPWVQCDKCERWVHQICALFNGKIDSEKKPQLVKTEGGQSTDSGDASPSSSSSTAKSTTVTTTVVKSSSSSGSKGTVHSITTSPGSEFLCPECLLEHRKSEPQKYKIGRHAFSAKDLQRTKLSDFLERRLSKSLQKEREDEAKWTQRDVKDVETAEGLTVRLVSNIEKQLMVRDKMFQRYKDSHKYTSEHRFKSKCICMFQEIDGVSVLLFGMYVHEFDEQEADCNSRRVYISYLDSVNYFKPAHLRTKVYHEVLIAYFDFVKQRGFHTAHLWACPPLKGDDYILYCHPEAQKTPKSDRLRAWYVDMLVKAEEEGVVWQITNMYDDYWRNDNTPCALPYFEGDYWVGLAEDLIEKLDAEKPKKIVNKRGSKSHKRKNSDTKKAANKKSKSKKPKRRKTATGGEASGDEDEDDDAHEGTTSSNRTLTVKSLDTPDRKLSDPLMHKLGEVIDPMKDDFLVVKLVPCCRVCNTSVVQGTLWRDHSVKTEHGLNPKVVQTALCDGCYLKLKVVSAGGSSAAHQRLQARLNALTKETVALPERCTDPDETNDSEFFDTRQAFLSLCQGNHYQFDELRRAKHSSMMALYHLGNPNPNAYVYECNACTRDIVTGNRWHCHTCPDFDVCDACYAKEKHEHPLEMVPTSGGGAAGTGAGGPAGAGGAAGTAALTAEQRRLREQRAKNVRLHMQLLVHSSSCADGNCGSSNCEKMKELMRHGAQCKQRAYGGCTICRRVWALLQLHARQCRQYECKVPRCHDLREHVRKLQLQQQLMDDRRRAAVTQQYRQMQSERQQEQQSQGQVDEPMPQA